MESKTKTDLVREFIKFNIRVLNLDSLPEIKFTQDKSITKTYAHNDVVNDKVVIYTKGRSLGDILRSLAHELIHYAQKQNNTLFTIDDPGATGSPVENEANACAGIIMRHFGQLHPQIFE